MRVYKRDYCGSLRIWFNALLLIVPMVLVPFTAHAYLGPGAGLGMIGSLLAVAVVVLIVVLGLVIYPIRMHRKRKRHAAERSIDMGSVK